MEVELPPSIVELNCMQSSLQDMRRSVAPSNINVLIKESNQGFENIIVERRYKREFSLPTGVDWNISNFDPYLNFDENLQQPNTFKVIPEAQDDRLVPEEGVLRPRSDSLSSETMDDKHLVYHNLGVKTFSTVRMDSGSTCISSDHTYINPSQSIFHGLDIEETYQNLDTFLRQVPEIPPLEPITPVSSVSPVGSPMNDSNLEYSILSNNFSMSSSCSQDSFSEKTFSLKRSTTDLTADGELFLLSSGKRKCESPDESPHSYYENRKKNNIASKNCRKTRKEKQKEMESRVTDLEKEKEELNVQVTLLEGLINAHKRKLYAIFQQRQ